MVFKNILTAQKSAATTQKRDEDNKKKRERNNFICCGDIKIRKTKSRLQIDLCLRN